jgi:DNA-directed RNA polymerase subunit RPC12/RpoP
MDHRGLRDRLIGAACTSCGASIAAGGIVVLADRGDVAFAELACTACGSRTLTVVVPGRDGPEPDTATHAEPGPATGSRRAASPALGVDDVEAMHRLLEGWQGDLRSLLDGGVA